MTLLSFEAISTSGTSFSAGIRVSSDNGRQEIETLWYTDQIKRNMVLAHMYEVSDEINAIAKRCAIMGATRMHNKTLARVIEMQDVAAREVNEMAQEKVEDPL